ncbi:Bicarbonate transporter [Salix suchowensis]|nr:Bicarbonate transporter [Salix suchowensis]
MAGIKGVETVNNSDGSRHETVFDIEKEIDDLLPVEVILCGLIGIPPSNGVIPQSPMHTKSSATLKHQILRNRLVATARKCMGKNASLGQVYSAHQKITVEDQIVSPIVRIKGVEKVNNSDGSRHETVFDIEKEIDDLLPVEVKEQRLTNLLQAIKVGGCVAAMPFVKMIPTS